MLKGLKSINVKDYELNRVQDAVKDFLGQLNPVILDGIILENIPIGTSTTLVSHGLSRKFQGWQLVDIQGDARIWRDSSSSADSTKYLPLKASAAVTASVWVF